MDPYTVLGLDPDVTFDAVIVAHRRLTWANMAVSNRFTGQDPQVRQRMLDQALRRLEPFMSALLFVVGDEVVAAAERLLVSAVGPESDLSEHPGWHGGGCS